MTDGRRACPGCGSPIDGSPAACAVCGTPLTLARGPDPNGTTAAAPAPDERSRPAARPPENPFATDLNRRLARLAQWAEAADPLGVRLPRLPPWAEEAAARARSPEPWAEVVRGVERLAQRRIAEAFDAWESRTTARIVRLEAYAVDSRLERSQVEDAVHAAKVGDIAQALATFHQVDRVVTLKERHLDQARGELERLLAFLRDLEVLGFVDAGEPGEVAAELERELRTGRLAPLKQRLRVLRTRAAARLTETLAEHVARVGDRLAEDGGGARRSDGARELALAARAVILGHAEEGARRLRALAETRGLTGGLDGPRTAPGGAGPS